MSCKSLFASVVSATALVLCGMTFSGAALAATSAPSQAQSATPDTVLSTSVQDQMPQKLPNGPAQDQMPRKRPAGPDTGPDQQSN